MSRSLDNVAIGRVLRSEDPAYSPGDYAAGYFSKSMFFPSSHDKHDRFTKRLAFENYSVYPGKYRHSFQSCQKITKLPGIPLSAYAGLLGLAGTQLLCLDGSVAHE